MSATSGSGQTYEELKTCGYSTNVKVTGKRISSQTKGEQLVFMGTGVAVGTLCFVCWV